MDVLYSTTFLILTFLLFLPSSKPVVSDYNSLVYKTCGVPMSSVVNIVKFRELMEEAFMALENGIVNSNGYCRVNYKWVELMARCEGDSSDSCECRGCVYDAVEFAKEQCGSSLSAQIYMDKCFINYIYQPGSDHGNGIPRNSVPAVIGFAKCCPPCYYVAIKGNHKTRVWALFGASRNNSTEKLAAIIVGGAAAVGLGFIFLSFLNSRWKKGDFE